MKTALNLSGHLRNCKAVGPRKSRAAGEPTAAGLDQRTAGSQPAGTATKLTGIDGACRQAVRLPEISRTGAVTAMVPLNPSGAASLDDVIAEHSRQEWKYGAAA